MRTQWNNLHRQALDESVDELRLPKVPKPCVMVTLGDETNAVYAAAVTWIAQSGHQPPRLEMFLHKDRKTLQAIREATRESAGKRIAEFIRRTLVRGVVAERTGKLVLSYVAESMVLAFDAVGTETANDANVNKRDLLLKHGVEMRYTPEGIPYPSGSHAAYVCDVELGPATADGYVQVSCFPTAQVDGNPLNSMVVYPGKTEGSRIYYDAATMHPFISKAIA